MSTSSAEHSGWHYTADCALLEHDYSGALGLYRTSLRLARETGDRLEIGFEVQGVFTAQIALPPRYSRAKLIEFYEQFYQRLAALSGASSVAFSNRVPLTGDQPPTVVAVAGRPLPPLCGRAS